jgi:hypothetical protein
VPHAHLETEHTAFAHGGPDSISFYYSSPITRMEDDFIFQGTLSKGQHL